MNAIDPADEHTCPECQLPADDCPCAIADNYATGMGDDERDDLLPYFGPEDDVA